MCGIIGRISYKNNPEKSIEALKFLEYRGYDSYGILLCDVATGEEILHKDVNAISVEKVESLKKYTSNIEIGHTRWATHGKVTIENAHPHYDKSRRFYVVMNGIIENFDEIREEFEVNGYQFISQSDTEVIPAMYGLFFERGIDEKKQLLETTRYIVNKLKGDFSFIVKYKNYVITYKNVNPIILGLGEDEITISSDLNLIGQMSDKFHVMNDKEILFTELNGKMTMELFSHDLEVKNFYWQKAQKSFLDFEKDTDYYMEKEILEQKYLKNLLTKENLDMMKNLKENLDKPVYLLGAGTSYHAAYYMHYMLLRNGIMSRVVIASELENYTDMMKDSNIVVFSQSGETADLIFPLKDLELKNNSIYAITNTSNSTLDRMAKRSFYLNCGREIAVASTKAFTAQMMAANILESVIKGENVKDKVAEYERLFDNVISSNQKLIEKICDDFIGAKSFFFIGRNKNYPLALEGALKLKEISYIHAEGFAGGELKHGSLALIEEGIPVVVLGNSEIMSNAIEIKTRGGYLIGIGHKNNAQFDYFIKVPQLYEEIFSVIMMQILSLNMTIKLGYNPDKPRNLAKSVTVK